MKESTRKFRALVRPVRRFLRAGATERWAIVSTAAMLDRLETIPPDGLRVVHWLFPEDSKYGLAAACHPMTSPFNDDNPERASETTTTCEAPTEFRTFDLAATG